MDTTAFNYNPSATVSDSSCIPFIYGCTDSLLSNYDPLVNTDDGSCSYTVNISPNNTPRVQNLNVFISGTDTSDFKLDGHPAVFCVKHDSTANE